MGEKMTRTICDVTLELHEGHHHVETLIGDIEAEVHFDYEPEDEGCYTMPNGDPGWPGSPASIEINSVITTKECVLYGEGMKLVIDAGIDVKDMLSRTQMTREQDDIIEAFEQKCKAQREEAEIDRFFSGEAFA